jgi:hypothetical protein
MTNFAMNTYMNLGNFVEEKSLDKAFGQTDYTPSSVLYVALLKGPSSEGNLSNEVNSAGYNRVSVLNDKASGWSYATQSPPSGYVYNLSTIQFGTASTGWGTITHCALMSTSAGTGNIYAVGYLLSGVTVASGDTCKFDVADAIVLTN